MLILMMAILRTGLLGDWKLFQRMRVLIATIISRRGWRQKLPSVWRPINRIERVLDAKLTQLKTRPLGTGSVLSVMTVLGWSISRQFESSVEMMIALRSHFLIKIMVSITILNGALGCLKGSLILLPSLTRMTTGTPKNYRVL